jgi:GWxTD domain-containing protein
MKKILFVMIFVVLLSSAKSLICQFSIAEDKSSSFYFDAVCFKNMKETSDSLHGRVDVFVMTPFQTLNFEKVNDLFVANYEIMIEVYDSNKSKVLSEKISRDIAEKEYFVTQGGNASFDKVTRSFELMSGKYEFQLTLIDLLSRNTYKKSREINIVIFDKYSLSLSGILVVSSIEERNGKFIITPHLSDNIGILDKIFFAFFEIYNNDSIYDSIDVAYEIVNLDDNKEIFKEKVRVNSTEIVNRNFKKINIPDNLTKGTYRLRIIALKPSYSDIYTDDDYLAITERTFKYFKMSGGYSTEDIDLAIRYLRYVANQSDIEYIESATNLSEKQKRFETFWKALDPSPNTERNEAFDEYYSRIDYSNKTFKAYNEGWLTDMGMVYIIYGQPAYIDQSAQYSTRGNYIKWTYMNNREFWFVDNTGLGDYRFARNYPIMEKYKYR